MMLNIKILRFFVVGVLGCSALSQVYANPPSNVQIIQWITNVDQSSAYPKQDITVQRTESIVLYSNEKAYLSAIRFNNAPRNAVLGYVLTRPTLKQSRILDWGGQTNDFKVDYFYLPKKNNHLSLIELGSASTGQGYYSYIKSINYVDGWSVKTLHKVETGDDTGAVENCKNSYDHKAYLQIVDQHILETIINSNGCENKKVQDYKVKSKLIPIQIPLSNK